MNIFKKVSQLALYKRIILITLLLIFVAYSAFTSHEYVWGRVTDINGAPIIGANVAVATYKIQATGGFMHGGSSSVDHIFHEALTNTNGEFKIRISKPFWQFRKGPGLIIMKHGYASYQYGFSYDHFSNKSSYNIQLEKLKNVTDREHDIERSLYVLSGGHLNETPPKSCMLINARWEKFWLFKTELRESHAHFGSVDNSQIDNCKELGLIKGYKKPLSQVEYDARIIDDLINPLFRSYLMGWSGHYEQHYYNELDACFSVYIPDNQERPKGITISCLKEFTRKHDLLDQFDELDMLEIKADLNLYLAYKEFVKILRYLDVAVRDRKGLEKYTRTYLESIPKPIVLEIERLPE